MPSRIQRKRTKGWRKPEGAVYVGRGTRWGNPYTITRTFTGYIVDGPNLRVEYPSRRRATAVAVDAFRAWLGSDPGRVGEVRAELAYRDLMCWCAPADACHADVLLDVAAGGGP